MLYIGVSDPIVVKKIANLIGYRNYKNASITKELNLIASIFHANNSKWEAISLLNLVNNAASSSTTHFTTII